MKRLVSLALLFAIVAGVFSPMTLAVSRAGMTVMAQHALAQTSGTTISDPYTSGVNSSALAHTDACTFTEDFIKGSLVGCVEGLLYYIPYSLGAWLMGLSALVFDSIAGLSLSSALYSSSSFIQDGWTIIRDFANIMFILVLLYIALMLVLNLGGGHSDPKRMIGSVVFVALMINFSFFLTSVIIDVSNTLALTFYNRIEPTDMNGNPLVSTEQADESGSRLGFKLKPVSIALVRAFQPQVLASDQFYQSLSRNPNTNNGGQGGFVKDPGTLEVISTVLHGAVRLHPFPTADDITAGFSTGKGDVSPGIMITIFLLVGAMFIVVAYSLFVATLSLLGRLVTLWVLIIFSPVAFISMILPGHLLGEFGWSKWWKSLISAAFAAPIYFFFLWLVARLAQSSIVSQQALENGSFAEILIPIIISFLLLVTMLLKGTKYIKQASGEIGEAVFKGAGVLGGIVLGGAGLAVGAATGGLALAGRSTIGRFGKKAAENQDIQNRAKAKTFDGWVARQQLKIGAGAAKASFDLRQNKVASNLSSAIGMNMGSFGALSTKNTAGGLEAAIARDNERDQKIKKLIGYDKGQEEEINKEIDKKKEKMEGAQDELAQLKADRNEIKKISEELTRLNTRTPYVGSTPEQAQQRAEAVEKMEKQRNEIEARLNKAMTEGKTEASLQKRINDMKKTDPSIKGKKVGDTVKDENGNDVVLTKANFKSEMMKRMGIGDLEKAAKNVKDARFKEYLLNKTKHAGYGKDDKSLHVEKDALGNLKSFHVDTKHAVRNMSRFWEDLGKNAGKGMAGGLLVGSSIAPGIGTAVGMGVGAGLGGLVSVLREISEWGTGGKWGSRFVEAESVHHSLEAKDGDKHHGAPGTNYKPNISGPIGKLQKLFAGAFSGGGGGGHGGGYDDHGGGHDDHGHH